MKPALLTREQLLALLTRLRDGRSLSAFNAELGEPVSIVYLGKVLCGEYHPGPKLAAALGFEQITMYRPVGRKRRKGYVR